MAEKLEAEETEHRNQELAALNTIANATSRSLRLEEVLDASEEEIRRRTEELAALNAIAATVSDSLNLQEILDRALDKVLEVAGVEVGCMYLLDQQAEELVLAVYRGVSKELADKVCILKMNESLAGLAMQSGEPIVVDDITKDPRLTTTLLNGEGIRSFAAIPIKSRKKVQGVMHVASHKYHPFSPEEVRLYTAIANQISVAIENARLYEQSWRQVQELSTLEEIARQINATLDVEQILELVLNRAIQMTSAEAGAIDLLDRQQNMLSMLAGQGFPVEVCHARPWPLDRGVISRVVQTGQPALIADVSQDPDYVSVLPQTRSLLAVPMMSRGEVSGVIVLESPQVAAFGKEDLWFLLGLAGHTAIALENARLYQGAERQLARLSVLADLSRAISSTLDLQAILQTAVERTAQGMGARIATIRLIEGDHLNVGAAVGYRDPAAREHPISIDQRLAQIIEGGQPLILPDLEADPDLPLSRQERMRHEGVRAYLGVPMIAKGRTLGILSVYREEPHQWTPGEVELASTIANQTGVAIENARLYETAQQEITERKQAQEALRKAHEGLERRVEERTAELTIANEQLKQEIAERKRAEEALKASEKRYRSLFERVPVGLYRTTPAGQTIDANPALVHMLGYPDRESMLAVNTTDGYMNPEDRQRWQALMEREGVMRDFEVQWRRHDGKIIWVRDSARIVRDADGRVFYYEGAVEDITERKQAEEQLRYQAALLANVNDAIVASDAQYKLTAWNAAAESLYGWKAEEVLGKFGLDITQTEYPGVDKAEILRTIAEIGRWRGEVTQMHKDGTRIPVEISSMVLRDESGQITGYVSVNRDITERKQAEEALRRYAKRLENLHEIDQSILTAQSPEQIAEATLRHLQQLVPCQRASVTLFDFATHEAIVLATHGNSHPSIAAGAHFPLSDFKFAEELGQGKVYMVEDILAISQPPPVMQALLAAGLRSYISVPLVFQSELIGSLNLGANNPSAFTPEHLDIAREVADPLAVAIRQARLFEAEHQWITELALSNALIAGLSRVATRLQTTTDPEQVMKTLGDELKQLGVTCLVALLEPDSQSLVIRYTSLESSVLAMAETMTGLKLHGLRMPLERWPIAAEVVEHRRPLFARDALSMATPLLPDFPRPGVEHILRLFGMSPDTRAIYLPLAIKEQVFGALVMWGTDLQEGDLPAFSVFAGQVAVALENARLYSQLEGRDHFITRILDSIPSSLVVIDRALRVVSVNRNFLEKTRREARVTLGHKIEEAFPQVLLEYTRLDQKVREVFRTSQPVEGGKVSYRAPGLPSRIYFYRLIPLKVEGGVENVMLLMDDITEREQLGEEVRRAERHLASVVECANDLVVSLDPRGHIVTWNQAAERASGLKAEQAIGRSLLSLCAAAQQPVMAGILQGLAHGKGVRHTEANLLIANGQEVPIAWSCSPMRDDTGQVIGIVAVGRDLTERRRLETQLIQSAKVASLGVMAGGIAHELRNPLGIISASAQLLLERPDDAQLHSEGAQKIHAATQRASLIIENLLKFARPSGERMREVDLHAVLEATLALLAHQVTLGQVALKKEFQPGLPRVHGNPDLLQQVFINLILNACNAMPQGGTLTVVTRATKTGQVEIQFSDTGRGIPAEHLTKVFDPFFTTMPVGKGIGLGLSISYSLIQQHQGTIEVESQVDQGSTFTVRLPGMDKAEGV